MEFSAENLLAIKQFIGDLAKTHGFQDLRVSDIDTSNYYQHFHRWVEAGYHGDMSFLERNQNLRQFPDNLHPGTCRVLSLRFNYLPEDASFTLPLKNSQLANISRYALGRDYHKLMRKKLASLCSSLTDHFELETDFDYRVFVDSAPVLETAFAEKSGLGWKGKHSLIINQSAGSWFFLGEIFINLPLAIDPPTNDLCGNCSACINLCPTNAIIDGKTIDATRCISYLTIENKGAIPMEFRRSIGNRIYGCDDCQLACPFNRFSETTEEKDFQARNQLDNIQLLTLWNWNEQEFESKLAGSPIRRIGYQFWLRNLAVAIGNSAFNEATIAALHLKRPIASDMVKEHIDWAIGELQSRKQGTPKINTKTQKLIRCVETMLPRDA